MRNKEISAKQVETLAEMAWGADRLNNQGEDTFNEVPLYRKINYRWIAINVACELGCIIKKDQLVKIELGEFGKPLIPDEPDQADWWKRRTECTE